jgi:adenine-specific DNA-methyltransferase
MRSKSRLFLKQKEVRKSRPKRTSAAPSIEIKNQDAFEFLSRLRAGSIDLIVSSPPYCMGKSYENSVDTADFQDMHERLAPLLVRALRNGGSLCWQVGHHVHNGVVTPLDAIVYAILSKQKELFLRNRIVWTFAHGVHAKRRFSGRHETVLWFTKGKDYVFGLDAVRVPQKYPGKRHYKGPKKGEFSGNPLGKNPSDVWEIPNVKANHIEKTIHPCQFPVALVQRLIRALVPNNGLVSDPFLGSGTSAVAALVEQRKFIGCEIKSEYVAIARKRIMKTKEGALSFRPVEKPIFVPVSTQAVAKRPPHFKG